MNFSILLYLRTVIFLLSGSRDQFHIRAKVDWEMLPVAKNNNGFTTGFGWSLSRPSAISAAFIFQIVCVILCPMTAYGWSTHVCWRCLETWLMTKFSQIDVIWIQHYWCAYGGKIVNFVPKSFNRISKIDQFKITNCSDEDQVQSQSSVHTSLGRTVSFST